VAKFLITALAFLSTTAYAIPAITSATLDQTGITIVGSGFGADNPMVFWDNNDANFGISSAIEGDVVPSGAGKLWRENSSQWSLPMQFKKTQTRNNRDNIIYFNASHSGYLGKPLMKGPVYDTMYVSWWYKPGKSVSDEGGSNKFIRVWDDTDGYGTRISWTHMHLTCGSTTDWGSWGGKAGEWNHHEFYVNLAENQKKVVSKVNGKVTHDTTCEKDPAQAGKPIYVQILGFDHGSDAYKTQTTSLDDIYIGNSQARALVSASSSWSSSIKTEVLPIKTWSNTKIETEAISGYLRLNNQVYIYVVDKDGNVNSKGFKVSCPFCPAMN
jgi:hypothetical protein